MIRTVTRPLDVPCGPGRRPPDHQSRSWGRARGPRAVWYRSRRSAVGRSRPSAHGPPQYSRRTGGPQGPSESEPVRLAPVLAKRSRPSGYIVDAIPALSGGRRACWRLAASPPVSRLGLAWRRHGACADRCAECRGSSPKQARCFDRPVHTRWRYRKLWDVAVSSTSS